MSSKPLVSFSIPCYNHEQFIAETIESCLTQTYENIEIVLVDDASSDRTPEIIKKYAARYPEKIRFEANQNNQGQSLTARRAVSLCRGKYIAGIGSDDVSLPHRIEQSLAMLRQNPRLSAVFSKMDFIDANSNPLEIPQLEDCFNKPIDNLRWQLLHGNFLAGPSFFGTAEIVRNTPPNVALRYVDDFDLWLRMLDQHEIARSDDKWVKYRFHGRNLSIFTSQQEQPFAVRYETAACIARAIQRWQPEKIFPGKPDWSEAQKRQHRADCRVRLAKHCLETDIRLFGRPFILTAEAYRQTLIVLQDQPTHTAALETLPQVWEALGDTPRARGFAPLALSRWQSTGPTSDAAEPMVTDRRHGEGITQEDYQTWLTCSNSLPMNVSATTEDGAPPLLAVVTHVSENQLDLLANTIDSLAAHPGYDWHLYVAGNFDAPAEILEIPLITWLRYDEPGQLKPLIDQAIAQTNCPWVIEIPAGCRLDARINEALTSLPADAQAVFFDDDLYADDGTQRAPRFKPGTNPAALISSNLSGPLCTRLQAWLETGGTWIRTDAPWFAKLLALSRQFGWPAVRHDPRVLISLHDSTPRATESCLLALVSHLMAHHPGTEVVPLSEDTWRIRPPLPSPQPEVLIVIYSAGNLDLLERCLNSLRNRTSYTNWQFRIALDSPSTDQDLNHWLDELDRLPNFSGIFCPNDRENPLQAANRAVAESDADYLCFLNENAVLIQDNWLEELVRSCIPEDIAGCSPRLIQPGSALIENAGSVLGLCGLTGSPYRGERNVKYRGYLDLIHSPRDVSTLAPACMLIRNTAFRAAGGLEADAYTNQTGMLDLCLKLFNRGKRLLYNPAATIAAAGELPHPIDRSLETQARLALEAERNRRELQKTWWPKFAHDPFWNRNLSLSSTTPQLETECIPDWLLQTTKAPRILAHAVDNAQGDYRILSPMHALRERGMISSGTWRQHYTKPPRYHTASELIRLAPDVHIIQNYVHDFYLGALEEWQKSGHRPFTVYALDDLITHLDPSNPYFKNFPPDNRARLKYALERCDRLVVSTDFLAEQYRHLAPDIRVVPNRLEMHKWLPLETRKRTSRKPRIGWAGGVTHQNDLALLKEVVEKTRDEADWIFFGMCPDEIRPMLHEYHPFIDYDDYPTFLASLNFDIAVAPLTDTLFNCGKSNLRLLELGVLGIPVVCSNVGPYRGSPACLVENTAKAWLDALRARLHDPDAREAEGEMLRQWVHQNYLLERHLEEWLTAHLPA